MIHLSTINDVQFVQFATRDMNYVMLVITRQLCSKAPYRSYISNIHKHIYTYKKLRTTIPIIQEISKLPLSVVGSNTTSNIFSVSLLLFHKCKCNLPKLQQKARVSSQHSCDPLLEIHATKDDSSEREKLPQFELSLSLQSLPVQQPT